MNEVTLNQIDAAKVALMVGIVAAIKAKYENFFQAAAALGMESPILYRLKALDYNSHSLAWLIQLLDRLGATVTITVQLEKPTPIKEPVKATHPFRHSIR